MRTRASRILAANTGLAEVYKQHGRILLAFADAAGRGPEIEKAWHDTVHTFVAPVVARIGPCSPGVWPTCPTSRRRPGPWCG